jgi:hypothetical protein
MMGSAQSQLYLFRGRRQSGFLVLRRSAQLCLAYYRVRHRRFSPGERWRSRIHCLLLAK